MSRSRSLARVLTSYAGLVGTLVLIVFALPRLLPGDPLTIAMQQDGSTFADPADRAVLSAHYGLDRPIASQFAHYVWGVVRGDLGWSISRHQRVTTLVCGALPWTLLIAGAALALASTIGFFAGVLAAWHRGGTADRLLSLAAAFARSLPDYAVATASVIVFAVSLRWFPLTGARTPFSTDRPALAQAEDVGRHAVLPVLSLTVSLLGAKFLLARSSTRTILGEDFLLLARAKGLPERLVRRRHGAPNALVPFVAQMGTQVGIVVGGSVFVERVFAYPGMGTLITQAVDSRDYPLLDGCFLTLAVLVVTSNAVIDLWTARYDHRMASR